MENKQENNIMLQSASLAEKRKTEGYADQEQRKYDDWF